MQFLIRTWTKLPCALRAVIAGVVVTGTGTLPWQLLLSENAAISPKVPWAILLAAIYLRLYWLYWSGRGWPRSTAEARRADMRARPVSARVWIWSLGTGGFALVAGLILRLVMHRLLSVPPDAFPDLSKYSTSFVLSAMCMTAITAGIAEETGFRGYMQSPIERRHGPFVALAVAGVMFVIAHYGPGITFEKVVWYLVTATIFGVVAWRTGSILPGIVLHSSFDIFAQFYLYWRHLHPPLSGQAGANGSLWTGGAEFLVVGTAAALCFWQLAATVKARPSGADGFSS